MTSVIKSSKFSAEFFYVKFLRTRVLKRNLLTGNKKRKDKRKLSSVFISGRKGEQ